MKVVRETYVPTLTEWTDHAISDEESHFAVACTIGGLLRACRKWDLKSMGETFELIHPILVSPCYHCDRL